MVILRGFFSEKISRICRYFARSGSTGFNGLFTNLSNLYSRFGWISGSYLSVYFLAIGSEVAKIYRNTFTRIRGAPYIEWHFTSDLYIKYPLTQPNYTVEFWRMLEQCLKITLQIVAKLGVRTDIKKRPVIGLSPLSQRERYWGVSPVH